MKISLALLVLLPALLTFQARAGTITGTVNAQGKQGAATDPACGKYDSRQFKFAERVNYDELRDFIVFIAGPLGQVPVAPEKTVQVVTSRVKQEGAMFNPHVLPILVNTTVEWPNNDDIMHNVFSFSETKPFDLDLYTKKDPTKSVKFDKPGRVDVFCSIHSKMNCVVLVLENPYFATTDKKGRYSIANVPPGSYKLKAWHERLPSLAKDLVVPENGEVKMDFTLGILNLPKL